MRDKQLLDSVAMVHKAIHAIKSSRRKGLLVKLYMEKAYNKVDWSFLDLVWIKLVLQKIGDIT